MLDKPSDRTIVLVRLIDPGFSALATGFKWGALAWIGYCASDAVRYLAGQQTEATISIVLDFLTKTGSGTTTGVSLVTAVLATFYGLKERQLRSRKVEHLQGRVRELESKLDVNRTTSGLTPQGRTNPKDQ